MSQLINKNCIVFDMEGDKMCIRDRTSFEKIQAAIESVYSDDGVLVLMDMGSAVMTTEMVIETFEGKKVEMVN